MDEQHMCLEPGSVRRHEGLGGSAAVQTIYARIKIGASRLLRRSSTAAKEYPHEAGQWSLQLFGIVPVAIVIPTFLFFLLLLVSVLLSSLGFFALTLLFLHLLVSTSPHKLGGGPPGSGGGGGR